MIGGALATVVLGVAIALDRRAPEDGVRHEVDATGWVSVDPHVLALKAGCSDNVYALASCMQSEGGGNRLLRIAVGWCARNMADRRAISVFKLLTRAGKKDKATGTFGVHPSNGFYGPQNVGPRYASTRLAPSKEAIKDAADVLADDVDDPTNGANQWDAPGVQDSFLNKVAGYSKSAEEVARERTKSSDLVMVPGITSTRFWRPRA
jgi:hypothetical protein